MSISEEISDDQWDREQLERQDHRRSIIEESFEYLKSNGRVWYFENKTLDSLNNSEMMEVADDLARRLVDLQEEFKNYKCALRMDLEAMTMLINSQAEGLKELECGLR